MKTKTLLVLVVIIISNFFIIMTIQAQPSSVNLIDHETNTRHDVATALHFFNDKQAVVRFRDIQLNSQVKSLSSFNSEDQIYLNLFQDVNVTATIGKVREYMEGNVTITAKLNSYDYAYMIVSTSENRTLAYIEIPEINKFYEIISDPTSNEHFLIELDPTLMDYYEDDYTCQNADDEPTPEELEEIKLEQSKPKNITSGPYDNANIDVMIVYTVASRDWANDEAGGISNLIANSMAASQLILDNSDTYVTLNLVYNSLIDYIEGEGAETDLKRLRKKSDGYMDEVHDWRDTYGADLVQLIKKGGEGSGIASTIQFSYYGFSVVGATHVPRGIVSMHEMGHNLGCGHHKDQNYQPGPGLIFKPYSAGWRWTDSGDGKNYCSIMTYTSAKYFDDGIANTRVKYFSNPSIYYSGEPTGHSSDGDNARTIRETKHDIAAYRDVATIGCIECPGYNWELNPTDSWKISSSTIGSGDCKIYRFNAEAGRSYYFKTGCGDGATANFDTKLFLLNDSVCGILTENNDGCEDLRSQIHWVADYDGYAYIKVRGYEGATGNYTMAYRKPNGCNSDLQNPSTTLVPEENWKYQEGLYPGEFSRFLVTEGETYHWQLCADKGANAPYDSELTLRKATSDLILEYSDNVCSDDAKISWTADFTGGVKLVITKTGCQTGSEPTTLAYKSGILEDPDLTLTPDRSVFSTSGTANFFLASNTSWSLSKDAPWITSINPKSGSGNATVTINYNENPTSIQRTATITATAAAVSDAEVTFKQFPSDAYCNSTLSMGTTFLPTDEWQYNSEIFAGMFATTPVVSGIQYHWSLCTMHGAAVPFDAELVLRRSDSNEFIAFSDGGCGFNDAPVISWTADFTGNVKIILANNSCEFGDVARIGYKSGELTTLMFTVSYENIFIPSTTGTTTFFVYTDLPWNIYIPPSKDPSWISVQPQTGIGNATITVTYQANTSDVQRQGPIVINAGASTEQVMLIQMPNDGHCNSINYNGSLLNPNENWQYKDPFLAGDYQNFAVDSGLIYHWSLCPGQGGQATFNSALTLRKAHDNSFVAYNNNFCGDDARISWTSDFTGVVKLVLTEFPCAATQNPARIAFKSGALVNPFPFPPAPLMTPGQQITSPRDPGDGTYWFNIISNTSWALSTNAGWFSLSQTSGTGNAEIIIYYEPNTGVQRSATITGSIPNMPGVFADNIVIQTDYCTSQTYLTTATPTALWQYINCVKAGEYVVFPVVEGEKYQWSFSGQHGGNSNFDSELTLRNLSDNSFIAYSNDYNGDGQDAYILWIAEFTGNVKLVCTESNCQTSDQTCSRLAYKKGDLNFPFLQFDQSIHYADSDTGSFELNIFSNTSWNLQKDVAWINPLIPNNGSGNATITVSYLQNQCLPREGHITGSTFGINNVNTLLIQESNLLTAPSAYAGFDATILGGQNYTIHSAEASNFSSLLWSTNGTGYLNNPTIVNPTYFPGPGEFGQIILSLSAFGAPGCFFTSSSVLNIVQGIPIELDLRIMLEGPFLNNQMTTDLNDNNILPLNQPYNQSPWYYQGLESVPLIPSSDIVDWVYVELRHSEDEPEYFEPEFTIIDKKAGFLLSDGTIRGLDGASLLNMQVSDENKTRVAVWHRNHTGVISSSVIEHVSGNLYQWNFTDGLSKAYNNGQKPLGGGYYGMIAGDGNADGTVDILDHSDSWAPNAGKKGYYQGDYDANTDVDNKDKNEYWFPNLGAGSQIPE